MPSAARVVMMGGVVMMGRMSRNGFAVLVDLGVFVVMVTRVLVGRRVVIAFVRVRECIVRRSPRRVVVALRGSLVVVLERDCIRRVLVEIRAIIGGLVVANDRARCVVVVRSDVGVRRDVKPGQQLEAREPQHARDQRHPGARALATRYA